MSDRAAAAPVGVVVMAYGSPASPDAIEEYYTHIRHGRPPTAEQLAELTARYRAIGGTSPMAERTRAQVAAITAALDQAETGRFVVELGQKHASPFVEDGVEAVAARGAGSVVGLVLSPHPSKAVAQYHDRLRAAAEVHGLPAASVVGWHLLPEFLDHQAASLSHTLEGMPERTKVVFTAHSLPERVLEGDAYPDHLRASAEAIAGRAGLSPWAGWGLAWQSAGRTPEPWRGPDVLEVIRDLAGTGRSDGIVVVPHGFAAEHLEVLYDLDVEAAGVAREVGLAFARTAVVDDDPAVMGAIAELVRGAAG